MEIHVAEAPFGNHVKCSSYPNLSLFRTNVQNVTPGRKVPAAIHRCVMKNDFDGLKRILSSKKREAINDCDHFGRTAFHIALQMASPKALYLLLYYPLIHPSKIFATLDWDALLAEQVKPPSEDCDVFVQVESDVKEGELEKDHSVEAITTTGNNFKKPDKVGVSTGKKSVNCASTGITEKGNKRKLSEVINSSLTPKDPIPINIGTCLLKHWEESPSSYTRSVLSLENGQNLFGCGVKEVETLYEEHYKFLVGEPNDLERAAKNYSAKYPRLYANHPANIEHIKRMMDGDVQKVNTRLNVETNSRNRGFSTSITTYLSDPCKGDAVEVPKGCSNNGKKSPKNKKDSIDIDSGTPKNNTENGNTDPTIPAEQHTEDQQPMGRRFRVAELLNSSIQGTNYARIPLVINDIVATFDKTAPIHLLFSNIYVQSSRENICKCFRILLHYFNKSSDFIGGLNLYNAKVYRYPRIADNIKDSFKLPKISVKPTSVPTSTASTESSSQVMDTESKVSKRFSLTSLGVPSSSRTSVHSEKYVDSCGNTPKQANADLGSPLRINLTKTAMKPDCNADNQEYKRSGDADCVWEKVEIGSSRMPLIDDRDSVSALWTTSPKSPEVFDKAGDATETVNTLLALDIGDGQRDSTDEKNTSTPSSKQSLKVIEPQRKNYDKTSNDRRVAMHGMNKTLCADVSNMNADVLSRSFSAIGDFRHCEQRQLHKTCFQIPVKRSKMDSANKYLLIEQQDPKMRLLNAAILSSNSWLKPTQVWETFVNKRDYTRSNILHKVCQIKDVDMIKWLLARGCMPLVVNEVGDMPVHLAMETNDPICLVTILHATLEGLFHYKVNKISQPVDLYDEYECLPNPSNLYGADKDSSFSKFMDALKYVTSIAKRGADNGKISSEMKPSEVVKASETPVSDVVEGESADCSILNGDILEDLDDVLQRQERVALFDEMVMLMEQLTYRGIKSGSWEALVALLSYNEAMSYHLLSNPHFMHRFIYIAVLFGKSKKFLETINYIVKSIFRWSDKVQQVKSIAPINNVGAETGIVENVPALSLAEDKPIYEHNVNDSKRDNVSTRVESFRGCGIPSEALQLNTKRASKKAKRIEPTSKCTAGETQRRLISFINKFKENVSRVSRIADNKMTWIITHPTCLHHLALPEPTDAPQRRHRLIMTYPENPTRLEVLISNENGILRSDSLENVKLLHSPPPATLADVLRVHDWGYINKLLGQVQLAQKRWQTHAYWPVLADGDTPTTPHSWKSALYAAGAVLAAVDAVCNNNCRNAFCAVRPPGHHLGTWGGAQSENFEDEDFAAGSQGFCLINNVAVGAAYAKYIYANKGIRKIAIIDFDIHHGNGTDQIVRNIGPRTVKCRHGTNGTRSEGPNAPQNGHQLWFGWRDVNDREEVFFSSIHAYDGVFYPGTGKPCVKYDSSEPRIINVAVPEGTTSPEFRVLFETKVLPYLLHFNPDLIFISAGFDGHYRDSVSSGFAKYTEKDFFWATERLVSVANTVCNGRLVSVLEGGYNTRLDTLSPFAKCVFEHVKALSRTGEASLYPLMHCEKTIEFLISPVMYHKPTVTEDASRMRYMEKLLYDALNRERRMKESAFQLLKKIYNSKTGCVCSITNLYKVMPTYLANFEALAQTDNCFYSFYSKNFMSFFNDARAIESTQSSPAMLSDQSSMSTDVVTFEKLMGIDCSSTFSNGSMVSYNGNSLVQSKLVSANNMWSGEMADKRFVNRHLYSNPWSIGIKLRSVERNTASVTLLLEYFKANEARFTRNCCLH
ncbi:putative histone deacetylase [Babesia divergens]|uniref:Histone deacetylase n=1 Tax=Babesia divergens TaxID=32595 RepID=A0AAD9GCW6_BABDI|nr:putative histone deacetylase [Babesia divergens]